VKIGIDISQTTYEKTGVGNYLANLVCSILEKDKQNKYVLFFSSLRGKVPNEILSSIKQNPRAKLITSKIPPTALNILWNNAHIVPIENFIGKVDLFISSDWAEPPSRARKATIIYDLTIYKSPDEMAKKIVDVQKRKLEWVKRETDIVFTISKSGKHDVEDILGIDPNKVKVIYPGM
jgi:hypothetical protein